MSGLEFHAVLESRGVDVEFTCPEGNVLAVLGPNGAGKSSVLAAIAGLVRPDGGRVALGGRELAAPGVFVPPHARGVAMLSQQPLLFPHMSVANNVAFGLRSQGMSKSDAGSAARRWLRAVAAEDLAERRPAQLSGGQAQRIALARALATEPELLLLDEPMAALDVAAAPAIRQLLRQTLAGADGQRRTALLVTHDILDVLALADSVIVLEDGRVTERGPAQSVLAAPRSDFGARLAGLNLIPGTMTAPGSLRCTETIVVHGRGDAAAGEQAVALFRPSAVAVFTELPHGSPRNALRVRLTEMHPHGSTVRVVGAMRGEADGPAVTADITSQAAAELDLTPGREAWFVVKAQEVALHPAVAPH